MNDRRTAPHSVKTESEPKSWRTWLWILLGVSLLARVLAYLFLPPTAPYLSLDQTTLYFYDNLQNHFWDFIRFTGSKPPMPHVLHALVAKAAGAAHAHELRLYLIQLFLLDLAALGLLFHAAVLLRARNAVAFACVLGYSLALVPFELWRDGFFYDQLTTFFTAFFAYAVVRCLLSDKRRFVFLLAASGALLVFQSAVNLPVVPVTMSVLFCCKWLLGLRMKAAAARLSAALLAVLLAAAVCRHKNSERGEASVTSNEGGAALMMVVQKSFDYDVAAVRRLIQEAGAPDWYLWCYDHPKSPLDASGAPSPGWKTLSEAFGICFPWTGVKDQAWPFDFRELDGYLTRTGQSTLAGVVRADMKDARERRHLYAGYCPELEPRWIGVYGSVSYRVALHGLRTHPLAFLRSYWHLHYLFAHGGPYFPRTVMDEVPAGALPARRLFRGITTVVGWCFGVAYHALYVFFVAAAGWLMYLRRRGRSAEMSSFAAQAAPAAILFVPLVCLAVIFSTLVGGENDRYFIQIFPYLTLLSAWGVERLVSLRR